MPSNRFARGSTRACRVAGLLLAILGLTLASPAGGEEPSGILDAPALQKVLATTLTQPVLEALRRPSGLQDLPGLKAPEPRRTLGFLSVRLDRQFFGGRQGADFLDLGAGVLRRDAARNDVLRLEFSFRRYTAVGDTSVGSVKLDWFF